MDAFFGVCGFFGIFISLIFLCIRAIRKQPKTKAGISLLICFFSFILGVALSGDKDKLDDNAMQTAIASYNAEPIDRSVPDETSEEETTEEIREIITEELTEEITTEQQEVEVEENVVEDLVIADTEETEAEITTELTTEEPTTEEITTEAEIEYDYVLNKNTKKFHYPTCKSVNQMKDKNKKEYHGTREEVIDMGYVPCKNCNP